MILNSKVWLVISLITILVSCSTSKSSKKRPRICIVGAGIAGASTATFLTQLFKDDGVDIDVYEKSHVGGKMLLSEIDGRFYETGGSAMHQHHKYMMTFVKYLGLSKRHAYGIRQGMYDGKNYIVLEADRTVSTYGQQYYRYGNSITNWLTVIEDFLHRFIRIYELQDKGHAFTSVEKLLSAIDPLLVNLTHMTAKDYLTSRDLSPNFVNEMITGVLRSTYGQTVDVNAFVGAISLTYAKPGLWSVKGGNQQVPQSLINKCKANLVLRKVQKIVLKSDGAFDVHSSSNQSSRDVKNESYDSVIVATPLAKKLSDISFEGFPSKIDNGEKEEYNHLVTTLVKGVVNTTYIEVEQQESQLEEMMTISDTKAFVSMNRVYPVEAHDDNFKQLSNVWKVTSKRPLTKDEINLLFVEHEGVKAQQWQAYPFYKPTKSLHSFTLHPGMYYTSGMDWAASAIEMSAISGRNAALLAFYHWTKKHHLIDSFPHYYHTEL